MNIRENYVSKHKREQSENGVQEHKRIQRK